MTARPDLNQELFVNKRGASHPARILRLMLASYAIRSPNPFGHEDRGIGNTVLILSSNSVSVSPFGFSIIALQRYANFDSMAAILGSSRASRLS